jgi:hypothetical protein
MLIRVGGTDADSMYYAPTDDTSAPPVGFQYLLCPTTMSDLFVLSSKLQAPLVFGVNAGPGPRDSNGWWQPTNLIQFLNSTHEKGNQFFGLEFGNEPNLFFFAHDLIVGGTQYGKEFASFAAAVKQFYAMQKEPIPLLISTDIAYQLPFVGPLDPFFMDLFAEQSSRELCATLGLNLI